jgi:hypothetical protein
MKQSSQRRGPFLGNVRMKKQEKSKKHLSYQELSTGPRESSGIEYITKVVSQGDPNVHSNQLENSALFNYWHVKLKPEVNSMQILNSFQIPHAVIKTTLKYGSCRLQGGETTSLNCCH